VSKDDDAFWELLIGLGLLIFVGIPLIKFIGRVLSAEEEAEIERWFNNLSEDEQEELSEKIEKQLASGEMTARDKLVIEVVAPLLGIDLDDDDEEEDDDDEDKCTSCGGSVEDGTWSCQVCDGHVCSSCHDYHYSRLCKKCYDQGKRICPNCDRVIDSDTPMKICRHYSCKKEFCYYCAIDTVYCSDDCRRTY